MRRWAARVVVVAALLGAAASTAGTPVAGGPETYALLSRIPQAGVLLPAHARP